jgi:ABC-2 type transport system permease protein
MNAFRAFPTLLRVGFAGALAYRAELIIWMLTTTMPLVSLALWSAVSSNAPLGRFGPKEFVGYFLAALIVRQITGCWLVWELNYEIKQGTLSQRLLKPIHPLWVYGASNLAAIPLRAGLCLPVAILAILYAQLTSDPALLTIFFFSLIGAWCINFFAMALVGSLAFYLESSTGIFELWMITFMILSGYVVPLELFPPWARAIADVLPFRYTLGFPVEVLTGMLDVRSALKLLAMQWLQAATIAAAGILAFRGGVKRFGAFGG